MTSKLRRLPALLGLLPLLAASAAGADCNDPFRNPNQLLDFHFQITRADWNALIADPPETSCTGTYQDFKVQFRCGTEGPWMGVALRKKRGTQYGVEVPQKPPLKIDFNETFAGTVPEAAEQSWPASFGNNGYHKLTLNNGQGNKFMDRVIPLPLLMAEHVAMRLLKREIPSAPGTAYAKVTIHTQDRPEGEYRGVYIVMEDIDKAALRRRFGFDEGRLVKNSKDTCAAQVEYDDGPPNAARAAYDAWIGGAATSTVARASQGLDLDTLLRQEAIREILVNGDDTIATSVSTGGQGLNWYSFDPRVGLRQFIPWDLDLAFGQQNDNCVPNSLKCLPTEPIGRWCANPSALGRVTVCQNQIRQRYLGIMCQLINGSMAADEILKVWEEAYQTVKDVVSLEKDIAWAGRDPASPAIDKSFGAEYVRLKAWIPQRINSVRAQIACAPGCTAGQTEACTFLTCPGQRRCENNRWTACQPAANCALAGAPVPPAAAPDGGVAVRDGGAAPPVVTPPLGQVDAGSGAGGAGGGTGGAGSGAGGAGGSEPAAPGSAGGNGPAPAGSGGSGPPAGAGGAAPGPGRVPPAGEAAGEPPAGCQCQLGTRSVPLGAGWLLAALIGLLVVGRPRRAGARSGRGRGLR